MRLAFHKLLIFSTILALGAAYAPAMPQQKAASTPKSTAGKSTKHRRGKRKASWKKKGQQGIKPERAAEIQQALIREKYLTGEPTGIWDTRSQAAMVKYQADHGWQTKEVPDSRALIKLGLGPNYSSENLLNNSTPAGGAPSSTTTSARSASSAPDKQ